MQVLFLHGFRSFMLSLPCVGLQEAPELLAKPGAPPTNMPDRDERWARNKAQLQAFSSDMPWDPFQVPWRAGDVGMWRFDVGVYWCLRARYSIAHMLWLHHSGICGRAS